MYMINKKSTQELFLEMSEQLRRTPGFEGYGVNSDQINSMLRLVASKLGAIYESFDTNNDQAFISKASGFFLDSIWGERLNLPRSIVSYGRVSCDQQNLILKTKTGQPLFAYLAPPIPYSYATLSPGVRLTTSAGNISGQTDQFVSFLTNDTQVALAASFEDVNGSNSLTTLAPGAVTGIDLASFKNINGQQLFTDAGLQAITLTNVNQILVGTSAEDDNAYRNRLALAFVGNSGFNDGSIKMLALAYPDVRDVVVSRWTQGSGSMDVLLIPSMDTVSASTIEKLQAAIEARAPASTRLRVAQPNYIFLSALVRSAAGQQAVSALQNVVAGMMPGQTFVSTAAEQQIRVSLGDPTFRILELRRDGQSIVGGKLTLGPDQMFRMPSLDVKVL